MPSTRLALAFAALLAASFALSPVQASAGGAFVVIADADNTATLDYEVTIESPLLDNRPGALFLFSQLVNPAMDSNAVYNPHPMALHYRVTDHRWTVENEDQAPIPLGAAFFIFVIDPQDYAAGKIFLHTTNAGNITANWTTLDHPLLNGVDGHWLQVTPVAPVLFHPHTIGVWYNSSSQRWTVFNQDLQAMPAGMQFVVCIFDCGSTSMSAAPWSFVTDSGNTFGSFSWVGWPSRAFAVFETPIYWGAYVTPPLGIAWGVDIDDWVVATEDHSAMPLDVGLLMLAVATIFHGDFEDGTLFGWTVSP